MGEASSPSVLQSREADDASTSLSREPTRDPTRETSDSDRDIDFTDHDELSIHSWYVAFALRGHIYKLTDQTPGLCLLNCQWRTASA